MDEEVKDFDPKPPKPPTVNGHAVPIKEGPPRSAKPVHRTQSLESEDLEMEILGQSYDTINEEDDQAGPLIPPPQGFGSPSKSPPGRPLSHSVPQVRDFFYVELFNLIYIKTRCTCSLMLTVSFVFSL